MRWNLTHFLSEFWAAQHKQQGAETMEVPPCSLGVSLSTLQSLGTELEDTPRHTHSSIVTGELQSNIQLKNRLTGVSDPTYLQENLQFQACCSMYFRLESLSRLCMGKWDMTNVRTAHALPCKHCYLSGIHSSSCLSTIPYCLLDIQ